VTADFIDADHSDKGRPCPSDRELLPRPPASGPPVRLADEPRGDPASGDGSRFDVAYCDEHFRFAEGSWGRFGRDDDVCQIAIWAEIGDVSLSRVAGELWCAGGDLWVRNLSTSHELVVRGGGRPQWLARREPGSRGAACSLPATGAAILAPTTGDWRLDAVRLGTEAAGLELDVATVRVEPVPERFVDVALALCAPLLERGDTPATYDEIARGLGISRRQARRHVEQLCEHYRDTLPAKVLPPAAEGMAFYQPLAVLLVGRGLVVAR
jgi:hypothetical protein